MSLAERDKEQLVSGAPRDLCCEIGCMNPVRAPGQRLCTEHHAERTKKWRKKQSKVETRVTQLEIVAIELRSELREVKRLLKCLIAAE